MKRGTVALLASLCVGVVAGLAPPGGDPAGAATVQKPAISEDARSALAQMGTALRAKELSFHAQTIRVYANQGGVQLHIVHEFNATVRRPDRLLVDGTGDDGPRKLIYDGKTVVVSMDDGKKYRDPSGAGHDRAHDAGRHGPLRPGFSVGGFPDRRSR